MRNFIIGIKAFELNQEEIGFINDYQPMGLILFKRNCHSPAQIKDLVISFKELCRGYKPLILIDQEGGRVNRLPEKFFPNHPSVASIVNGSNSLEEAIDKISAYYTEIGERLYSLGINVNCAPVADLSIKGAHSIIGDRSLGSAPEDVSKLAEACCKALANCKVQSIIKHIPGHGRALLDSHEELPIVTNSIEELKETDFKVFYNLRNQKMAMTAHILYSSIDKDLCATISSKVITYIRELIGFKGILLTDDLSMRALRGEVSGRAEKALKAGCDVLLHCNGDMQEMIQVGDQSEQVSTLLNGKISSLDCF